VEISVAQLRQTERPPKTLNFCEFRLRATSPPSHPCRNGFKRSCPAIDESDDEPVTD